MNNEVTKAFTAIIKQDAEVQKLADKYSSTEERDKYWLSREELNRMLRDFLETDFYDLSKRDFYHLCAMCSSHRPVEPFKFLIKASQQYERICTKAVDK